jgi:acetylglutamate kinase
VKVLIKLGGTLLEDADLRRELAGQLADVARTRTLVVVHGGGKQVTKYLEARGVETRFVNGLRVSDDAVMDAVTKVVAGTVNQQLVSAMIRAGADAVGLSGVDGPLTIAERLSEEMGWVGRPVETDARLLDVLTQADFVPVLACVAGDRLGRVYNVNADQMAVSCAGAWSARKLVFLTDVPGVRDAQGQIAESLTMRESDALIASGVAHGGMQTKLEAAAAALRAGVSEVCIAPGREPHVCQRLLSGEAVGTRILPNAEAA